MNRRGFELQGVLKKRAPLLVGLVLLIGGSAAAGEILIVAEGPSEDATDTSTDPGVVQITPLTSDSLVPSAAELTPQPQPQSRLVIYLIREDGDVLDPNAYIPVEVSSSGLTSIEENLRLVLLQLLGGPRQGLGSAFSTQTAGMLLNVRVEDGVATINFDSFDSLLPAASSTGGGIVLFTQLNATIFEFEEIEYIQYQFEGSCDEFWRWQQSGECHLSSRAAWLAAGRLGDGAVPPASAVND